MVKQITWNSIFGYHLKKLFYFFSKNKNNSFIFQSYINVIGSVQTSEDSDFDFAWEARNISKHTRFGLNANRGRLDSAFQTRVNAEAKNRTLTLIYIYIFFTAITQQPQPQYAIETVQI